jgi:hypothetical protein
MIPGVMQLHRMIRALAALACLAGMHGVQANVAAPEVIGAAYDLDSQTQLYSEAHCSSGNALAREVIYRDTNDLLLAHKLLNYQTGPTTPSYVQRNVYAGESISVEVRQDNVAMTVTDGTGISKTVTASIDTNLPLVIDAGFDAFVRENWEALVAGQGKRFQFPFAGRDSLVNLRIRPAQCSYEADANQCFQLELDNWALRLVVDPIELGYDAGSRRLVRYRGLSNIGDGKGEGQVVDIRYRYEDLPQMACDSAA